MLIVVINGIRKYFDRQQSRWTFPRNSVFHRGARAWRDYLHICTENADGILASKSGINKAAVFFVPHTFVIPAGPQQAESCSPTFPRLQRGARQETAWRFCQAAGPDGSSPAPGATALPSSLPAAGMLMLGSHPLPASWEKQQSFAIYWHWYFEESPCFLRRCTGFGQKNVNPQNVCPKFLQYNRSFFFPFLFFSLRWERVGRIQ